MTEETITISLKEYEDLKANKQRLESLTEDLNKACGCENENWLHASLHIGNFIANLKADIKVEQMGREKDTVELVELRAKYQNLLYKVEDFEDDYKKVMQEECAPDEKHCSCVPHLRGIIKRISNEKFAVWKTNCKDFKLEEK
jgi:hypothetical protein